jgi:hypothetical protein
MSIGAAVFLYVLLTGGVIVSCSADYDGQRDIRLVAGLKSDVWLWSRTSTVGLPMFLQVERTPGPFSLRLQIWDESLQYVEIEIAETLLEYADGEVIRMNRPWIRAIGPYTQFWSQSGNTGQTELNALSDDIENLSLRHGTVKVTLTGHLKKKDGISIPFVASETFDAEYRTRVFTLWQSLAGA